MKKSLRFLVLAVFCSLLAAPVYAGDGSGPSGGDPPPPPTGSSSSSSSTSGTSNVIQLVLTILGTVGL